MDFDKALDLAEKNKNLTIFDAFIKAKSVIGRHQKIICAISGGSDSDIMLDIIEKVKGNKNVIYVWSNTGLEFLATKKHLEYLEQKYNITIERESR